jgi:hypothetical protein
MSSAAAHEMHDFVRIAWLHLDLAPLAARHDFEIPLNRDSVGCDPQMRYKIGQLQQPREFTTLAVDDYMDRFAGHSRS